MYPREQEVPNVDAIYIQNYYYTIYVLYKLYCIYKLYALYYIVEPLIYIHKEIIRMCSIDNKYGSFVMKCWWPSASMVHYMKMV